MPRILVHRREFDNIYTDVPNFLQSDYGLQKHLREVKRNVFSLFGSAPSSRNSDLGQRRIWSKSFYYVQHTKEFREVMQFYTQVEDTDWIKESWTDDSKSTCINLSILERTLSVNLYSNEQSLILFRFAHT